MDRHALRLRNMDGQEPLQTFRGQGAGLSTVTPPLPRGGGGGTAVHDPPANGDEADPDPGGFLRDHRGRRAVRSNLNQGKGDRPRSGSRTLGRRGG
ncbi:hypothetical protein Psuf_074420 [Phytohabitans suffuscus]|uniref:Uncharacterized protein n=1 Tax=Phytohabitans suffuscus TaxID=624315 RepID=A0A6F8YVM7_9ACTN|nr:hypothetical protein Psuf_074420 [Phytohabitans suffuscus]